MHPPAGLGGVFLGEKIDKNFLFPAGVYEEGSCVSMEFDMEFDQKIWGALPIIVRVMYRVGCLFD